MGDVKVKVGGDSTEVESAFHGAGEAVGEFSDSLAKSLSMAELTAKGIEKAVEIVKELGEKVIEFGKESVEAYFQIEKANMQLERAAGENTEAFKLQAQVMSEHLGVSNTQIESMQKMLLTYGEAPSEIDKTIRALQDYAAFSGGDALEATRAMTMSVTTGRAAFKELGLQYEQTGEKSSTLKSLTEALAAKLGGTADEEADTLEGRMRKATNQTTLLKQQLGELIAEIVTDTGAVSSFTKGIQDLQVALRVSTGHGEGLAEIGESLKIATGKLNDLKSDFNAPFNREAIAVQTKEVERLQAALVQAGLAQMKVAMGGGGVGGGGEGPSDAGFHDSAAKAIKDGGEAKAKAEKTAQEYIDSVYAAEDLEAENRQLRNEKAASEAVDKLIKIQQDGAKATMEEEDKAQEARAKDFLVTLEQNRKDEEALDKYWDTKSNHMAKGVRLAEDALYDANKKLEDEMAAAGTRIADAFASAIVSGVEAAMDGGEFDVIGAVADVAFAVSAIAAEAIATAYGEPEVGKALGVAISVAGELEHHARSNAWASQQKANGPKKHHEGAWIEPERYHLGTDEVPAILQAGEAVLSRGDVHRMGGRQGVEAAKRGGAGGPVIYLSAMDTQGVMEAFQDRSGRGLYDAIRSGRGPLPRLFGSG